MSVFSAFRITMLIFVLGLLGACASKDGTEEPPIPMGNFLLGHNIIVADKATKGPLSRDASADLWEAALTTAMEARFDRYDGDKYYHIGTHVDAYVLAFPGIPLVASPKSVLIVTINVWDDATGEKLTVEPKQLTVLENSEKNTFILGSGLTNSKAAQMRNLSNNAARMIQRYLLQNPEWFGLPPLPEHLDDVATTGGSNN